MASPAEVLRVLFVNLGLGSDPASNSAWPIYVSNEPSDPDDCITLYDLVGAKYERAQPTGEVLGFDGFQVRVRSTDYPTGYTRADAIHTALAETVYQNTVTLGASKFYVHDINRIGDVIPLGVDNPRSKRNLFTINAQTALQEL
jgi:hypothetical protein